MSEPKLFACPFCSTPGPWFLKRGKQSALVCQLAACGVRTAWWDSDKEAADKWNMRPPLNLGPYLEQAKRERDEWEQAARASEQNADAFQAQLADMTKHRYALAAEFNKLASGEMYRDAMKALDDRIAERDEAKEQAKVNDQAAKWWMDAAKSQENQRAAAQAQADALRKALTLAQSSLRDREHQWRFAVEVQGWILTLNDVTGDETMMDALRRWYRERYALRQRVAELEAALSDILAVNVETYITFRAFDRCQELARAALAAAPSSTDPRPDAPAQVSAP